MTRRAESNEGFPMPRGIVPMIARETRTPLKEPGYLYEPKLDGEQAVVYIDNGRVHIQSRHVKPRTDEYRELAELLSGLPGRFILNAEIVILDNDGVAHPELTRSVKRPEVQRQTVIFPFDILYQDGVNLMPLPLILRKERLAKAVPDSKRIQKVVFTTDFDNVYAVTRANGYEGVFAKKDNSPYEPGVETRQWLKYKHYVRHGWNPERIYRPAPTDL